MPTSGVINLSSSSDDDQDDEVSLIQVVARKATTNHVVTPGHQSKVIKATSDHPLADQGWPASNYQECLNPNGVEIDGVPAHQWTAPVITGGFFEECSHRSPGRMDGH